MEHLHTAQTNAVILLPLENLSERVIPMPVRGDWDEARQSSGDTVCPYCGVGCTLRLHVQDGAIVKATSPFENDITKGNLCIKGRFGWQFVQPQPKG